MENFSAFSPRKKRLWRNDAICHVAFATFSAKNAEECAKNKQHCISLPAVLLTFNLYRCLTNEYF
jgi:hypothetical protein